MDGTLTHNLTEANNLLFALGAALWSLIMFGLAYRHCKRCRPSTPAEALDEDIFWFALGAALWELGIAIRIGYWYVAVANSDMIAAYPEWAIVWRGLLTPATGIAGTGMCFMLRPVLFPFVRDRWYEFSWFWGPYTLLAAIWLTGFIT